MSEKYNEVMEHVQLTAEARERILGHIENAGRTAPGKNDSGNTGSAEKILSLRNWRRYGAIAACLILMGILAALWPSLKKPDENASTDVASYWAEEYDSLEKLSKGIGFPVEDISVLSADKAEMYYLNIAGEIAHVKLENGHQMIVFRKSKGSEDNSGDYNSYTNIREQQAAGAAVTLKSMEDKVSLALWEKDGYFYSMSFEPEVFEEDALNDIAGIFQ